jgi:hypothetical protein
MFFQAKNILKNNRYHTPKQYLTLYLAQIFNNNFFFSLDFLKQSRHGFAKGKK